MVVVQPKTAAKLRQQADFEAQKLRALVAAWQSKKPALKAPKQTWDDFLSRRGFETRPLGWPIALGGDPRLVRKLKDFLNEADSETKKQAVTDIKKAVERELEFFAQGLTESEAAAARFTFALDGAKLEELALLVGLENFQERVDKALCSFDEQVALRRRSIQCRLEWKPDSPQKRVDREMTSSQYKPGQPNWWSGRLQDAPEMIGNKLDPNEAERVVTDLERSLLLHFGNPQAPCAKWAKVTLDNTYFAQGREPRVQFGQAGDAPGVEGYLKDEPQGGPRVLEFPLANGTFAYLMFDGHHRAAAQMFKGVQRFKNVTVMRLTDVEARFGHSKQDILEAIRDLHTHLYMTEAPVPR